MSDKMSVINEKAIKFMTAKDYASAASILSAGITLYEGELANNDNDDDSSIVSMDYYYEEDCVNNIPLDFETFLMAPTSFIPKEEDNNKETLTCSYTLFDKALTIPAARDHDCNLILSILLYNHALCLHFQALQTGNESVLDEALLIYEMALGLVGLSAGSSGAMVLVLELAILNNCGQIHSARIATHNVHFTLQRMQVLLQVLSANTEVPYKALSPFYLNLMYNAAQHQRPAPAA